MDNDTGRFKVYDAERMCSWWGKSAITESAEANYIINQMKASQVWEDKYKVRTDLVVSFDPVPLADKSAYDGAFLCEGYILNDEWIKGRRIVLAPTGRRLSVLLHELAHYVTFDYYPRAQILNHGFNFLWFYCQLVRDFMGVDQAKELVVSLVKCGVKI